MTTVKATVSVEGNDVDRVMSLLRGAGFSPRVEGLSHSQCDIPLSNSVKLVLIRYKWNNRKVWKLVEFFSGSWMFDEFGFEGMGDDDFEIVCWYDLPEGE